MPSDSDGQWEEKELHPDGLYDAYGTIGQGNPHHRYGENFGAQGDGFVLTEVADVGAQILLMDEPLV